MGFSLRYTVHSLVHIAARWFLSQIKEDIEALKTTAQKFLKVLPSTGGFANWPAWRVCLSHTTAFLENTGQNMETIEVARICYLIADYLHGSSRHRDAQAPAQRSFTIRVKLLGEEHLDTLDSMGIFDIANVWSVASTPGA
ncbi:hypothetical protein FPQ18DRAFT_34940 [Pyronema domesticum]|nr:hypothetical protein FPQ18DRAFT_34940 [Pyronema domesticum]